MAFFLIVPSVIIVTIFLVHSIAQRIGFSVKYFSLIMCAISAFVINVVVIKISEFIDDWYYVKLGLFILVSAIIVTFVNRFLIRNEKKDIVEITDVEIEEELELEKLEIESDKKKHKIEVKEEFKVKSEPKPILKEKVELKPESKVNDEVKVKPQINEKPKPKINDEVKPKPLVKEEIEPKPEPKVNDEVKVKPTVEEKVEVNFEVKPEVKPDVKSEVKPDVKTDVKPEPKSDVKSPDSVDENISEIEKHLGSLDDILDYAYSKKADGDFNQAILAYQKALNRYQNDDYAPFIAIDLGNIYKEQAAYSKVLKTYEEALKLPAVNRNSNTKLDFTKNITYIRILQSVLIRHRALNMPFSKIPRQYLQEVDNELKSMQMKSTK